MATQQTINFVRNEGLNSTTVAIVTVILTGHMDDEDIVEAIERGVTAWRKETEDGQAAWQETAKDFNIGDLANEQDNEQLRGYLEKEGILSISVDSSSTSNAFDYDRVLGNAF